MTKMTNDENDGNDGEGKIQMKNTGRILGACELIVYLQTIETRLYTMENQPETYEYKLPKMML